MDEDYTTFVLGKDAFSVADDLKAIKITSSADLDTLTYTIKAKCGLDTPLSRVLDLILTGMAFTVTLTDGKKYSLKLVPFD